MFICFPISQSCIDAVIVIGEERERGWEGGRGTRARERHVCDERDLVLMISIEYFYFYWMEDDLAGARTFLYDVSRRRHSSLTSYLFVQCALRYSQQDRPHTRRRDAHYRNQLINQLLLCTISQSQQQTTPPKPKFHVLCVRCTSCAKLSLHLLYLTTPILRQTPRSLQLCCTIRGAQNNNNNNNAFKCSCH
jgi:hypothetical protein